MAILKPIYYKLFQPLVASYLSRIIVTNSEKLVLPRGTFTSRAAVNKLPTEICNSPVKTSSTIEKLLLDLDDYIRDVAIQHPETLVKRCYISKKQPFYVVGKSPIDFVLNTVKEDIKDHDRQFIVAYPGPGGLVDSLIKADARNMLIFEPNKEFYPRLKNLEDQFSERIHIENSVLNSVLLNIDPWEESIDQTVPPTLPRALSQNVDNATMIAPISDHYLLRTLLHSVIDRKIWVTEKNLTCYFFLPGSLYTKVTSQPEDNARLYRGLYILWQIFFKVEMLEKFPTNQFLPLIVDNLAKDVRGINSDTVYFIKCTPRLWNATDLAPKQYRLLALFVKQLMAKPSNCFIAALEKWAPGVGIELIKNNYGVFTQSRTLNPMQILEVFRIFFNFPDVAESAYWHSLGDGDLAHEEGVEKDKNESSVAKSSPS